MSSKKKIPCRVCGKLFAPCSYCQSHADIFRWRNFACSIECATTYVNEAIAYNSNKSMLKTEKREEKIVEEENMETKEETIKPKRKYSKKQTEN